MTDDKTRKSNEIISQNLYGRIDINPNSQKRTKHQKFIPNPSERELRMEDIVRRMDMEKSKFYSQMESEINQTNHEIDREMNDMRKSLDEDMAEMRKQINLDMEQIDDENLFGDDLLDSAYDHGQYDYTTTETTILGDTLTTYNKTGKMQSATIKNQKLKGESVATKEKPQTENSLIKSDEQETDNSSSLDSASSKLEELQSAVESLIGQKVTPETANDYVQQYTSVEQGISSFLGSLVPLVEDNQKRKLKRDEADKLRNMWDSNMRKCQEKITKYESDYKTLFKELENSKVKDPVAISRLDNLEYVLEEWKTLNTVASTHTSRTGKDVEKLSQDMQKINKISYQISSFNLRLRTLMVTSESYLSSDDIQVKDLSSIQQALNVSLEKIKNLEKEQLAIMSKS